MIARSLTLNYGSRWDYDSGFPNKLNFSPRIGLAWSLNPKTVVRASWGIFYDRFRVGTARDVPEFGRRAYQQNTALSFPRLVLWRSESGGPNLRASGTGVPCISNTLTDAQIAKHDPSCMLAGQSVTTAPLWNRSLEQNCCSRTCSNSCKRRPGISNILATLWVIAATVRGRASSGNRSAAGDFSPGILSAIFRLMPSGQPERHSRHRGPELLGHLITERHAGGPPAGIRPRFGSRNSSFYHRDIYDILGVRNTNLAFVARIPGHTGELQPGTGTTILRSDTVLGTPALTTEPLYP